MTEPLTGILRAALGGRLTAIGYHISQAVAGHFPQRVLLESNQSTFDVWRFRHDKQCEIEWREDVHAQVDASSRSRT